VCWNETDGNEFCHANADVRISNAMIPDSDWNNGIRLVLGGAHNVGTDIHVRCVQSLTTSGLAFTPYTVVNWGSGDLTTVELDSSAVCPRPFRSPWVPQPPLTPTPIPPAQDIDYVYSFVDPNGDRVELNLFTMSDLGQYVVVGYNNAFERNYFTFHPVTPQKAPAGYRVFDADGSDATASVWRCVKNTPAGDFCHSVAHAETGLKVTPAREFAKEGVVARYGGGFGGYTLNIQFECNWSIPDGQVVFDPVGFLTPPAYLVLDVHSRMVCPNYSHNINRLSVGSVFMTIAMLAFVLYMSLGIAGGFIANRVVAFPHAEFWGRTANSITMAAVFVVTCGQKFTADNGTYPYESL
jgi:hypothetical protein